MLKKDVIKTLKYIMLYKADNDNEKQALDYAIRVIEKCYKADVMSDKEAQNE